MGDTTQAVVDRVKIIAPQITSIDETSMRVFASDAYFQALSDGFKDVGALQAAGYLAAHFATLANSKNSNIKSESAAVLSHEFFDRGGSDDYLVEYNRLRSLLDGAQSGPNVARFF